MTIFERISYRKFKPRVGVAKGSRTLTRSGVVLFDSRWTYASMYRNPLVVFRTLLVTLASLLRRPTLKLTAENGTSFGLVHSIWTAGYYHWLTESLPRALTLIENYPQTTILLPSAKYNDYADSLMRLGVENVAFFPNGSNVKVYTPVVTECPRKFGTTDPVLLKRVRDRLIQNSEVRSSQKSERIIYVSRRKSRGRVVLNEHEVEEILRPLGAEVFCLEDLSFREQVNLMQDTKVLISIHGAALTNMMFMKEGGCVVELLPRKNGIFDYNVVRNSFRHDACYVRLAAALGQTHHHIECIPDNAWYSGTHMSNIVVDVDRLQTVVREATSL